MRQKLFLIPGTMCNEWLWSEISEELRDRFDVFYIPIPRGNSLTEIVDILLSVLPDERVNLVGFSLGGYLASLFAIRYPERVGRLFIISNSLGKLLPHEIKQRQAALAFVKVHGYHGMSRKKAISLVDVNNKENEKIIQQILKMDSELGQSIFLEQMTVTTERIDLLPDLKRLDIAITFFYSLNDPLLQPKWIVDFCQLHQKSVSEPIYGSGHMLPLEKPQELLEKLALWSKRS